MTYKVLKYKLLVQDTQVLTLPRDARILTVRAQGEDICLWALVDTKVVRTTTRLFRLVGTGHEIALLAVHELVHLGTVMLREGALVFHVFEIL